MNNMSTTLKPSMKSNDLVALSKSVNGVEELRKELIMAKAEIKTKDDKIKELETMVDKLRSVLSQSHSFDGKVTTPTSPGASIKEKFFKRSKKQGVSAEVLTGGKMNELVHHNKDMTVRNVIRNALLKNPLLQHLEPGQITEIIECMYERKVTANSNVIEEGLEANNLYVAQYGKFDVFKDKIKISEISEETAFGELALLYNCRRTATVKACTDATLWVIDRGVFKTIMRKTCSRRHAELQSFLKSVSILKGFSESNISKLADLLEVQVYSKKECIIRQGETASSFFIIQSGSALVTQKIPDSDKDSEVRVLSIGDYFGEKALLTGGVRSASVFACENNTEILCLYRSGFLELVGDINEIKNKDYGDEERFKDIRLSAKQSYEEEPQFIPKPFSDIQKLKTLGVGGFGRVYLVRIKGIDNRSFALKCMKKDHIIKMKQQMHVLSEKNLLLEIKCNFICRLYQTYKDAKYVYLLSEVCLGGELWSVLRDKVSFEDITCRFCLSCVIAAFEYLHKRNIIYRDLKPENLLISGDNGYLKLCDFGFAKKVPSGKKTWTFCGTPEYVAPEIILNKSHDSSADLWSLGILTYELLNGMPPFTASDPMKIYAMTLKGIEGIDLGHNKKISLRASSFITNLCRKNPAERLGNGKNGFNDIKNHKYFQGFDWEKVERLKMKSPFVPKVNDPFDASNFDQYPEEGEECSEENSGWDINF